MMTAEHCRHLMKFCELLAFEYMSNSSGELNIMLGNYRFV